MKRMKLSRDAMHGSLFNQIIRPLAFAALCCLAGLSGPALAAEPAQGEKHFSLSSMIIIAEGQACLGQERSRAQAQQIALSEAKRTASEQVVTHVTSQTNVKDGMLTDDLVNAYSQSTVKVLEELEKGWFRSDGSDGSTDFCYRVRIRAEVVPAPQEAGQRKTGMNDPRAPLTVELWTGRETYHLGEAMKFYFRGNKPFYARAVYIDANGQLVEITPYARSRHYEGGVTYEIPGRDDLFSLLITQPVGRERLILYASTRPMGQYDGQQAGNLYMVRGSARELGKNTRGLTVLHGEQGAGVPARAEFAETETPVRVEP